MSQSWDVSKYRSPHEPNYQWELRKKFMEQVIESFKLYFIGAIQKYVLK